MRNATLVSLAVLAGCGPATEPLSLADTVPALTAVQRSLVEAGVGGLAVAKGTFINLMGCPEGGIAEFAGSNKLEAGAFDAGYASSNEVNQEAAFSVSYRACRWGTVQLDGDLEYAYSAHPSPGSLEDLVLRRQRWPNVVSAMRGTLTLSGAVTGSCEINRVRIHQPVPGQFGNPPPPPFSYQGTVCGNDARPVAGGNSPDQDPRTADARDPDFAVGRSFAWGR